MANFKIPKSFLEKLHELTGDGKNNKGFMLFYVDAQNNVRQVISKMNDVTLSALRKRAESFLRNMDEQESIGINGFDEEQL